MNKYIHPFKTAELGPDIVESRKRSIAKAAMYRAMASALLAAISWVYTGDLGESSLITLLFTISATIVYYINERLWTRIRWF